LDVSLSRFLVVHRNATREHPVTGEIELARQDLLRAQQDIDLEIADARAELGRNDDYRKLAAADGALLDKITAEKDPKKRTALATERLALRAKLSSAEKTALAENPRVHAARVAAIEAGQKLERLELDRRVFLLQEPEFVAARTELVTARSALIR
jgi:hypothetical protein